MTARRRVVELAFTDEDLSRLMAIARSRTEPASRVERARMLLAFRDDASFFAVGQALGVHHQTVQRCIARAVAYGPTVFHVSCVSPSAIGIRRYFYDPNRCTHGSAPCETFET